MTDAEILAALKQSDILPYPQQVYGDKSNITALGLESMEGMGKIAAILQTNYENLPHISDREELKSALAQSWFAIIGLAIALGFTQEDIEQASQVLKS